MIALISMCIIAIPAIVFWIYTESPAGKEKEFHLHNLQ